MLKWYGWLGLLMLAFAEINFVLKIQPFALWYFLIIWPGYILAVDALVYRKSGKSLINNQFHALLWMFLLSAAVWWAFEFINIPLKNWEYIGVEELGSLKDIAFTLAFSTVIPAMFETIGLVRAYGIFDKVTGKDNLKVTKARLYIMITAGLLGFIGIVAYPSYMYPFTWVVFFLVLDPANYLLGYPSILRELEQKKTTLFCSILLAAIIMGFLWEFWNYWAVAKWTYDIPYLGFFKIFEMPVLGYIGYFPFALELYAIYWFFKGTLGGKKEGDF